MTEHEIKSIYMAEKLSRSKPIISKFKIGQEVDIKNGAFKGISAQICTLPSKKRVGVLLHLLGAKRRMDISETDLAF